MNNSKQPLTLKALNEKIEALTNKLDLLLTQKMEKDPIVYRFEHDGNFNDIKVTNGLPPIITTEITDENGNVFVNFPTIYVDWVSEVLAISLEKLSGFIELTPQRISKYKNALIDGKVRSISGVAPNFNQMSYLRFEEFIKWAGGEMLNWKTVLYLQILWLFTKKTKETKGEDYNWNTERYTGYQNTGKGIGEFLGIEQLFSGYTLFSLENNDDPLFELFKKMGMETAEDYNDKFGYYRNFFDTRWFGRFDGAWDDGGSARLCKNPFEGVEGEDLPFQDVKE
ncbi:MAG: hypothetical protein WCY90_00140 [Bacilli bacterium]